MTMTVLTRTEPDEPSRIGRPVMMLLARLDRALRAVETAASSLAAYDFISLYVIVALFFLALSPTFAANGHINVDLLHHALPRWGRRVCEVLICALSAGFFGLLTETSAARTWEAYQAGDVLAGSYSWPTWASLIFVPLGAGLLTLRLALSGLCHLATLLGGREIISLPAIAGSSEAIAQRGFE
jgi:TRAP-type C4-dicarboxylate transport system permease small subunit